MTDLVEPNFPRSRLITNVALDGRIWHGAAGDDGSSLTVRKLGLEVA